MLNELYPDVLCEITRNLNFSEKQTLRLVCKNTKNIIDEYILMGKLRVKNSQKISDKTILKYLYDMKSVKTRYGWILDCIDLDGFIYLHKLGYRFVKYVGYILRYCDFTFVQALYYLGYDLIVKYVNNILYDHIYYADANYYYSDKERGDKTRDKFIKTMYTLNSLGLKINDQNIIDNLFESCSSNILIILHNLGYTMSKEVVDDILIRYQKELCNYGIEKVNRFHFSRMAFVVYSGYLYKYLLPKIPTKGYKLCEDADEFYINYYDYALNGASKTFKKLFCEFQSSLDGNVYSFDEVMMNIVCKECDTDTFDLLTEYGTPYRKDAMTNTLEGGHIEFAEELHNNGYVFDLNSETKRFLKNVSFLQKYN